MPRKRKLEDRGEVIRQLKQHKDGDYTEPFKDCLKVVGSEKALYFCADMYERNADIFYLVTANDLLKFCETESFSDRDLALFKRGLSCIPEFFKKCLVEKRSNEHVRKNSLEVTKK